MRENGASHLVTAWSDEKLILLYCPGRGWNSRPFARRSVNMIMVSHALKHSATAAAILAQPHLKLYVRLRGWAMNGLGCSSKGTWLGKCVYPDDTITFCKIIGPSC